MGMTGPPLMPRGPSEIELYQRSPPPLPAEPATEPAWLGRLGRGPSAEPELLITTTPTIQLRLGMMDSRLSILQI